MTSADDASGQTLLRDPAYLAALSVAVVVALGFGLIVPVLPLFARAFGVGLFAVTAVVSAFAAVRLLSNLYTGGLTDRIGARRAVGWGAMIVALSSLATAAAGSYWELLALRAAGGFGSALFFNALLAHVVGLVPTLLRGRAVGGLQAGFLVGMALGPAVGGLLAEPLGLRWPFVVYAVFCASAGVVAWTFLPRVEQPPARRADASEAAAEPAEGPAPPEPRPRGLVPLLRVARELCTDPTFAAALVLMATSRWVVTGVRFSLVPVFGVEAAGASALVMSLALTLAAVTHLVVAWPAGKLADTLGRRVVSVPAYAAFAVVVGALGWATTPSAFVVAMAAFGVATAFASVTPPAIVGDLTPEHRTGVAIGVLNTAGDFGSVVGPLAAGVLADAAGFGAGFGVAAALLALGAVVALRMRETLPAADAAGGR